MTPGAPEQSDKPAERILQAATELFATHGYHGTSVAAIAQATGQTKGALYCHFASKGDLLRALINRFETQFLDRLIAEIKAAKGDAWDKLQRYVSFASRYAAEHREFCLLLTIISAELHGADSEFSSQLRRVYAKYARFLRRVVEEGKAQGVINSDLDTHTLAYLLIAFHDGVLMTWQRSRDFLDGPDFVATFRQVLFQGIDPRRKKSRPRSRAAPGR